MSELSNLGKLETFIFVTFKYLDIFFINSFPNLIILILISYFFKSFTIFIGVFSGNSVSDYMLYYIICQSLFLVLRSKVLRFGAANLLDIFVVGFTKLTLKARVILGIRFLGSYSTLILHVESNQRQYVSE